MCKLWRKGDSVGVQVRGEASRCPRKALIEDGDRCGPEGSNGGPGTVGEPIEVHQDSRSPTIHALGNALIGPLRHIRESITKSLETTARVGPVVGGEGEAVAAQASTGEVAEE